MYAYCDEHGIPYDRCGKVVVATDETELARLEDLFARASRTASPASCSSSEDELREVEPRSEASAPSTRLRREWSTFGRSRVAMAKEIADRGWPSTRTPPCRACAGHPRAPSGSRTAAGFLEARAVITCAGVYSDRVAAMTGGESPPRIVPFRGRYYALNPRPRTSSAGSSTRCRTRRSRSSASTSPSRSPERCGPGPTRSSRSPARDTAARQIDPRDLWDTLSYSGFRGFARRHWRTGLEELRGDLSRRAFVAALQRLVPDVRESTSPNAQRHPCSGSGQHGQLVDDFRFDHAENIVHVRNAPSPGATSSLAIAAHIVDDCRGRHPAA